MGDFLASQFGLQGKTAVVTGATRGIGRSMAIALAKAGADTILVQRNLENTATRDEIRKLGQGSEIVAADLADASEVRTLASRILQQVPRVDILINCGGIQRRHPAHEFPDEDWNEVLQVNLNAVFTLSRDLGRHMLETAGQRDGNAKIINVASLCSYQGGLTIPAYASSKHAVLGLTRSLSNEWISKGINVNAIAPGYINSQMNTALIANPTRSRQILERIPAGRWGECDDFEGVILFLAGKASAYVSGECIVVDGGWMGR